MTESWLRQRLAAHTALRLVVATVLLGLAVVVQVRAPGALPVDPFFVLIGATFAVSVGLLASLRLVDRHPWMASLHFGIDAVLVSACVYLTGGINSLFTTLYVLPIVAASTGHLRRGGLQIAALNAVLFVGLVVAQFASAAGRLDLPFLATGPGELPELTVALYTVGLNVFGFFAVALLSGSLADRARRADVRLERATEEMADLQAFNQYVLDNLLSGLATADAQNRLLTFNRSAMSITGLSGAPPVGRPAAEVLQLPPAFTATLDDELSRIRSKRTDYEFRRADGRVIEIGLSVAGLPLPDGGHGYLYTFQDVTEVKRIERNARLQQRLAAVGEMAAGIAHEIRNPLASMSGSMQMLRQELSLTGDQAQLMDIVLKESERLNQTIKSFLAYARPQKLQVTRLDLRTLVGETGMLLRNSPEVAARHRVEVTLPDSEVPVDGDESQLRQILWNLATNGLRAMPDGGELRLAARAEAGADGSGYAVMEVTDHGVGISPEDLEGIFQPFRGSFGRGTGLGLAIVHRIITDYGGRIDVQSQPGEGTTFTVRFPSPVARASSVRPGPGPSPAHAHSA
jgi:two-component system sensor histidine kinase PilS (NtrC family)